MNPWIGWALALVALVAGWRGYGWPGLALAFSVIVFWLLMQFHRSIKVMRNAAGKPVGFVDSAVMFNAKLRAGLPMLQVITLARSLGRQVAEEPEAWAWADAAGAEVTIVFANGRCKHWVLSRPPAEPDTP